MADVKRVATRQSYGEELVALGAERDDFLVLDADLAAATQTGRFKAAYPDRFVDCGIAEQNLMGVAAGIAATGHRVFASTFAMFAAGRAFEQVRNSIGYPHLHVVIGATHAGISVGEDGATHQCNEDIALMRAIPGMTVVVPSDDVEARAAVRAAYEADGPVYLRLGRLAAPVIHGDGYRFEVGRGVVEREGAVDCEVLNLHTVKPLDADLVAESAAKTGRVVTVEEHSVVGGLGGAVCEALAERCPVPVRRVGVRDVFGESGPAVDLLAKYGLDGAGVAESIRSFLR